MSEEAGEYKTRCTSTHWHQGEELRCIDWQGHTSAHYNVVWWSNERGLPWKGAPTRAAIFVGWLIAAAALMGMLFWLLFRR